MAQKKGKRKAKGDTSPENAPHFQNLAGKGAPRENQTPKCGKSNPERVAAFCN